MDPGELMVPVAAGPVRGPRHARLLQRTEKLLATRAIASLAPHNRFDVVATSTNNSNREACSLVLTIYARTRLRLELAPEREIVAAKDAFKLVIDADVLAGDLVSARGFARLIGPAVDLASEVDRIKPADVPRRARRRGAGEGGERSRFDPAVLLGYLERANPKLAENVDAEVDVVSHDGGPLHLHVERSTAPGGQHLGVYLEGVYCPDHDVAANGHDHAAHDDRTGHDEPAHDHTTMNGDAGHGPDCHYERFTRMLNASVARVEEKVVTGN
jgi:hypothetical protein